MMRTTIDIEDSLIELARTVAFQTRRSIGAVISEWAKNGLSAEASRPLRRGKNNLPVFDIPPGTPPITSEKVRELLEDGEFSS